MTALPYGPSVPHMFIVTLVIMLPTYLATKDPSYLQLAHQALALFTAPPPIGVRVATPLGARYVQYTFTPGNYSYPLAVGAAMPDQVTDSV